MSLYSVKDKVALVTGAARGVGLETARGLHARGARVVLVDLDPAATAAAARQIGPGTIAIAADVTDAEAMRSAVAETDARVQEPVREADARVAPAPARTRAVRQRRSGRRDQLAVGRISPRSARTPRAV